MDEKKEEKIKEVIELHFDDEIRYKELELDKINEVNSYSFIFIFFVIFLSL